MKKPLFAIAALVVLGLSAAWGAGDPMPPPAPVNATFQRLTTLVGDWKGTTPDGKPVTVSYTLVSDGSALMEKLKPIGPSGKVEEMISMYAPDGDGVMMTHYCSMHNQPRMRAAASPDGALAFKYVDATNLPTPGAPHMDHVTMNLAADKLTQEWAFKAGGKEQSEVFSYSRVK